MSDIYLVTIFFNKTSKCLEIEEIWSVLWQFVSSLYKNGNLLNAPEFFAIETGFVVYNIIPGKNSLSDCNINKQGLLAKEKLKEMGITVYCDIKAHLCDSAITLEPNVENVKFLTLYPVTSSEGAEMRLALRTSEGKYLPNYILSNNKDPYLSENLNSWKQDYKAINTLWLSSHNQLESVMAAQLTKLDSDISIKGVELSKKISNALQKQVFYPLAELKNDQMKYIRSNYQKCPSCTDDWYLKNPFLNIFSFKCDECSLLGYDLLCYL